MRFKQLSVAEFEALANDITESIKGQELQAATKAEGITKRVVKMKRNMEQLNSVKRERLELLKAEKELLLKTDPNAERLKDIVQEEAIITGGSVPKVREYYKDIKEIEREFPFIRKFPQDIKDYLLSIGEQRLFKNKQDVLDSLNEQSINALTTRDMINFKEQMANAKTSIQQKLIFRAVFPNGVVPPRRPIKPEKLYSLVESQLREAAKNKIINLTPGAKEEVLIDLLSVYSSTPMSSALNTATSSNAYETIDASEMRKAIDDFETLRLELIKRGLENGVPFIENDFFKIKEQIIDMKQSIDADEMKNNPPKDEPETSDPIAQMGIAGPSNADDNENTEGVAEKTIETVRDYYSKLVTNLNIDQAYLYHEYLVKPPMITSLEELNAIITSEDEIEYFIYAITDVYYAIGGDIDKLSTVVVDGKLIGEENINRLLNLAGQTIQNTLDTITLYFVGQYQEENKPINENVGFKNMMQRTLAEIDSRFSIFVAEHINVLKQKNYIQDTDFDAQDGQDGSGISLKKRIRQKVERIVRKRISQIKGGAVRDDFTKILYKIEKMVDSKLNPFEDVSDDVLLKKYEMYLGHFAAGGNNKKEINVFLTISGELMRRGLLSLKDFRTIATPYIKQ